MSIAKDKNEMDVKVVWDGGIGEVAAGSFEANLPEDLKPEHFQQVDDFRSDFAAAVGQQVVEKAQDWFPDNEDDLSIVETGLGGNATMAMTMGSDCQLVTQITVAANEALEAVAVKAKEVFKDTLEA
jgi:hypothetical protein